MPDAAKYNPNKAHAYYERTKNLKGRQKGTNQPKGSRRRGPAPTKPNNTPSQTSTASATVTRLKAKVDALTKALSEAQQALSEKRQAEAKSKRQNSDGKSTAKQRASSQKYRDTHKAQIAAKTKSASGSGSSSSSSSTSVSSMSVDDLVARVSRIQSTLSEAKRQLSEAMGNISHADFIDPELKLSDITLLHSSSRKDTAVETADFSGYATAYDLRCTDGRTIRPGAFDLNDGQVVPLVWQHGHDEATNVLGHAKLIRVKNGMRCEAFFNATAVGQHAKEMVKHGDVKFLSIWADKLVERVTDAATRAKDVLQGNIREVSLVLGGANPGAFIDDVAISHGDGEFDNFSDEAYITTGIEIEVGGALTHADDNETVQDVLDTLSPKQMNAVNYLVNQALIADGQSLQHSDTEGDDDASSTDDSGDAGSSEDEVESGDSEGSDESSDSDDAEDADNNDGSDEGAASDESSDSEDSAGSEDSDDSDAEAGDAVQHNDNQEDNSMTHNVFDSASGGGSAARTQVHLSHGDIRGIVEDWQGSSDGSLKRAVERFVTNTGVTVNGQLQHGIENIDYLFPDAKALENSPQFVSRRMEWVDNVLN